MSKKLNSILGLILFVFLVSGCQHKQNETIPSIPGIDMSSDKVNQDINLVLWHTQNTFKIDDRVVINVRLQSDIQVDSDFDVKMYTLDKKNNKWIETGDFVGTYPFPIPLKNETIILDKNNSNSIIIVHPVLQEKNSEIKLLITVKGPVLVNNEKTNKNVESYVILTLHP